MKNVFRCIAAMLLVAGSAWASQDQPTPTAGQHPNGVKGFDPNGVFSVHGLDTINAWNGNLTVSIPIGPEFSIGGGLTYQLRLYSNSNVWDTVSRDADLQDDLDGLDFPDCREPGSPIGRACTHAFPDGKTSNAGLGWNLSLGRLTGGAYVSPDGSEHKFFQTLHRDDTPDDDGTLYTRDGTYLRMKGTGDHRTIEFPNGEIHTFVLHETGVVITFRLEKIGNRFDGNALNVTYEPPTGPTERIILSDGWRTHTIHFTPDLAFETGVQPVVADDPPLIMSRRLVDHVDVAAFNGATARYQFVYDSAKLSRPNWHTIPETISNVQTPRLAQVQQLKTLRLPDGMEYTFGYDTGHWSTGLLNKMTLPAGGWMQWIYQVYEFPSYSAGNYGHMAQTPGVMERHLFLPEHSSSEPYAKWTYDQQLDGAFESVSSIPAESKTTITDPLGNKTEHYFDVSSLNPSTVQYGLPFTPRVSDGNNRFLSTRFYPAGKTTPREKFVRYERDAAGNPRTTDLGDRENNREVSVKTKNEDNTSFTIDRSDFDGLGHYRTVKEYVDGVLKRTTTTDYNPARGTYPGSFNRIFPVNPWVIEQYPSVVVTDGTSTSRSEYCFDQTTGFLNRKRTMRNAPAGPQADLLAVFTPDPATGDVIREQYYGGDKTPLPGSFNWQCGATLPAAAFTIDHTRTRSTNPATGAKERRHVSRYAGHSFTVSDISIDESSDLPASSRDLSGVETKYSYDLAGRLTELRPAAGAWSQYVYPPNSGTSFPRQVVTKQWAEGAAPVAGSERGISVYHFDGLGRLVQDSRKTPTGWSRTRSRHDQLDRRITQYSPVQATDSNYVENATGPATTWAYDSLGRVTSITQPDGSSTRVGYQVLNGTNWVDSTRIKRTTTDVRTSVSSTNDTAVTIEEETDGFGRLIRVTEDADPGAPLNASTSYTYDLGGNLATVTMGVQTRTFTYDTAGLLRQEQHPESGTTTYTYNARGQAVSRTTPQSALAYEYDTAQRLIKVIDGSEELKVFKFFDSGSALGKLEWSLRNNRYQTSTGGSAKTTVPVKESFTYDAAGRITKKETKVDQPHPSGDFGLDQHMTFTDQYAYDELGAVREVTYPACSGCGGLTAPARKVSTTRQFGLTTAIPGYTAGIEYHPNGMLKSITHLNQTGTAGPVYQQTVDGGMTRPAQISVSNVCDTLRITTHPQSRTAMNGTSVTLTAAAEGNTSWQWYERTPAGDQLMVGKTTNSVPVTAGASKAYFVRIGNGTCTVDSAIATVTGISTCGVDATILTAEPADISISQAASVPDTAGATYSWSITGGTIVGSATVRAIVFTPGCATTVKLTVTVTVAGCVTTNTRDVAVRQPSAQVTGSVVVTGQTEVDLSIVLTGTGPWTTTWSDGFVATYSSSPATRPVTPSQTTTYSIVTISAAGCTVANAGSAATVTVNSACTADPPDAELSDEVEASYAPSVRESISMPSQPGATFEWTITNGRILSGQGQRVVDFAANCSGVVGISLKVTSKCGVVDTDSITVPIRRGQAAVVPETLTYVPGGTPAVLKVDMTDSYAARVTWSDGVVEKTGIGLAGQYTREVAPATNTTYTLVRAANYAGCEADVLGAAIVSLCLPPDATINAPDTIISKGTGTASVAPSPGATYAWTIQGGSIISGQNTPNVTFRSTICSGSAVLNVSVTAACNASAVSAGTKTIPVIAPAATITGSTIVPQGSSATLQVNLTGVSPWNVTWSDGHTANVTSSPYNRIVAPQGTTTYTLTGVMDGAQCTGTVNGAATVTVTPPAPANVLAIAESPTQVRVLWTMSGTADSYDVYRNGVKMGNTPSLFFVDTTTAATAYRYHVVSVKASTPSAASARDLVTTVMFTNDPVVHADTIIEANHILQLRTAVNAVRALSGLAAFAFTDTNLASAEPRAIHVTQLRSALDQARAILGLPPTIRSGPPVDTGEIIWASDIADIRGGVR